MKRKTTEARVTVKRQTMDINTKTTRLLGVYLNTMLQFQTHRILTLKKARRVESRGQSTASGGPKMADTEAG